MLSDNYKDRTVMSIVYGFLLSPYVRKVLLTLNIKNIPYEFKELHPLIPEQKQRLLQLNPLGKIPVYQDNNVVLPDSSVICAYLDKQYPKDSLYPSVSAAYAKSLWYEEYVDTTLTPTIISVFINMITAPALHLPPDTQALEIALKVKLPEICTYLDNEITGKTYFVGEQFSIADLAVLSSFMTFSMLNKCVDPLKWPDLASYLNIHSKNKIIHRVLSQAKETFQQKYGEAVVA